MSEPYIDSSIPEPEDGELVSNPGVKLPPNEHSKFYDDVRGMSAPRPQPEKPKIPRPLPPSVRRCCEPPDDAIGTLIDSWGLGDW